MRGRFADWLTASWLDGHPPTAAHDACRFAGVMTDDPFAVDPLMAEADGMVYVRRQIDWIRNGTILLNAGDIKLHVEPTTRVLGLLFFDSRINGTFGGAAYLDEPATIGGRGFWIIKAQEVGLGIDVL